MPDADSILSDRHHALARAEATQHRPPGLFIAVVCLATAARLALALLTYGTNDSAMWNSSARAVQERGPLGMYERRVDVVKDGVAIYRKDGAAYREIFNHPPFMVFFLAGLNALEDATAIPVHKSLRVLSSAADLGTLVFVCGLLYRRFGSVPWRAVSLLSIAPASLTISGFHGNTDPIMIFLLVVSVYLFAGTPMHRALGAAAFALASGIKIVPLLLLPPLLLWARDRHLRLQIVAAVSVFWLVTAWPWLASSPEPMIRNVFAYGSGPGVWGFTNVLSIVPTVGGQLSQSYATVGRKLLLAALLLLAVAMNWRRRTPVPLFDQFGVLFCALLLLAPGFGIQYLAWIVPWLVTLPPRVALIHFTAAGVFCTVVYTYWCGGLPWDFANAAGVGNWASTWLNVFAVAAWLSLWLVAGAYARAARTQFARVGTTSTDR